MQNNIYLNEQEILALTELISRAKEINYPQLIYFNQLKSIQYKIDKMVDNCIKSCTYEENGLKPCEEQAIDCTECDWYQEEEYE